ncbi:uncharacterized protein [Henckelia pumila]|uniref:uncharacterized protein n=1 Tax=Henckelia pumila TaxID=405737 RepID=UPI003C6E1992
MGNDKLECMENSIKRGHGRGRCRPPKRNKSVSAPLKRVPSKKSRNGRISLWEGLLECKPEGSCAWIVGGDFNVIEDPLEHSLGAVSRPTCMQDFSEFIVDAGLIDAGYVGSKYTWTNRRIWKRLDRVLISSNWSEYFNSFKVEHLHRGSSDHCPLQISAPFLPNLVSSFRFQNMWVLHPEFLQTVRLNCNFPCSGKGMFRMVAKLKRLKDHLKWWNKEVFGNVMDKARDLESLVADAEYLFDNVPSDSNRIVLSLSKANLSLGLSKEEAFWKQKAAC